MYLQATSLTLSGAIGLHAFNEDLLYLVFLRALPSIFNLSSSPDEIFTIVPLNFSLVCRSWRQTLPPRIVELKWLAVSSPTPLRISLEFRRRGLHALPIEILDIISPESSRCVDFYAFTHMDCVLPPARFTYNCSSTLASLILQLWNRDPIDVKIDFTSCIRGIASNLEVLNLHASVTMRFPSQEEALSLPKLRELTHTIVTPSQFDDVLCILFASPNIEKIDLTIYGVFRPNPMVNPRRILLPCLTSLTLLSNNRPIIMRFLTLLACPSLRSFDFGMPKMDGGGFLEPSFILDFISRPNPPPPLRSLSLTGQEPFVGAAQDSGHDTLRNFSPFSAVWRNSTYVHHSSMRRSSDCWSYRVKRRRRAGSIPYYRRSKKSTWLGMVHPS
ncbi:hypothetical protein SCHPADRAFT_936983 [Schizopora paradoxa]|uniref:F-box domain-containing protein n=1 Tax=Schizopora paradoxa TaxID=27342 RepID=A0A0H2S0S4_9AGAM|nr:hypothetical protein SCHPADRAFT_936983 [Schizopora paradoxa]